MNEKETSRSGKLKKSVILKNKIYRHAIDLFYEKGFENVKITDICEDLDISTGTFYYYYPSKEAVLLGFSEVSDDLMDEKAAALEGNSQAERLRCLIIEKLRLLTEYGPELTNFSLIASLKHRECSFMNMERSVYGHFMHIIATGMESGEFRKDINVFKITSLLRHAIIGLVVHWATHDEPYDIEQEATTIMDELLVMMRPNQN